MTCRIQRTISFIIADDIVFYQPLRLTMKRERIGFDPVPLIKNTIGIVEVAAFAARPGSALPPATITATWRRTRSAASAALLWLPCARVSPRVSGLSRSDFVLWPECDLSDVRFNAALGG